MYEKELNAVETGVGLLGAMMVGVMEKSYWSFSIYFWIGLILALVNITKVYINEEICREICWCHVAT